MARGRQSGSQSTRESGGLYRSTRVGGGTGGGTEGGTEGGARAGARGGGRARAGLVLLFLLSVEASSRIWPVLYLQSMLAVGYKGKESSPVEIGIY
jgi:hypothetical protein